MNSPNNNSKSFFNYIKRKFYLLLVLFFFGFGGFSQEINPNGYNIFYYDSGEIASEGEFKNGVPEGLWKTYYKDGTLKSTGFKTAGLSDSLWVFYDHEGRISWKYYYENDKKNGCAQRFDTTGYLSEEVFYIDDVIQGEKDWYYPSGELKRTVFFVEGKESGQAFEYSEEGVIITEEIYENGYLKDRETYNRLDENGKRTGIWREYYNDGTLKSESNYKEGQKFGISKYYNQKGKLLDIQDMTSDSTNTRTDIVLIEMYKEYYSAEKIKLIGGLSNGMKSGIYREYDREGNLINGYVYENDTLVSEGMILFDGTYEGDWKDYYYSGKIQATGIYKTGIKTDMWIYYYPSGKKEQEGKYKNNMPFGTWTWYYPNGQIKRTENYNAYGNLEGTMTEYDSLGKEIARGDYYNGMQEGPWFYQVGDHKEVGSFAQGRPDGLWQHYYLNGKLAFSGAFDEGEPKGKHIWYHQNGIKKATGKYLGGVKHGIWRTYDKMGEVTEEIQYKNGEVIRINGFKIEEIEVNI